jgi:hypothetical protein
VPSFDSFQDEGVREPHLVTSGEWTIPRESISTKKANESRPGGLQDESRHDTWPVTFSGSPHDFRDSVSDQEEDSDQDSYDQDMDYMPGDSDNEEDRGQVVAEMCNRWGWTLEDVLETLEQPGLDGRRKCSREKGILRA